MAELENTGTVVQQATTIGRRFEEEAVQEFRAGLRGELLRPGDRDFDTARKVVNGAIDKTPALIVRCAGVADVLRSVKFARVNELTVAMRGEGHNVAGNAVCDDGIVIDLSPMRSMRVDPERKTVRPRRVQGGGILIMKRRHMDWRRPGEWSRQPALQGSHSVVALVGCLESTVLPVIIFYRLM